MRWGIVVAAALLPAVVGCIDLEQTALDRASRELACPPAQLTIVHRPGVGDHVFDAHGCGRVARYTCFQPYRSDNVCVREPNPDPAEEAARRAAPLPPPEPRDPQYQDPHRNY